MIACPPRRTAVCGCAVTRLITSVSWTFQPIRAQASVTDDTCGSTLTRSGPYNRMSVPPMPCNSGSPLATTWMSSVWRSSSVCNAGSIGDSHSRRGAATVSSSRSSCRLDP